ncbi:hypothetical protein [Amycolatopsis sp. NPDC004625]|uniref:hypothetical protein n=1 Tax=Amycolatopsis sp. NPDC004625 TaxID=3154670 RepID=UPI0033BAC01F
MSQGTEYPGRAAAPGHPGRHRRGGAESWTPPLPQHRPVRHHATGRPADPPVGGVLPQQADQRRGGGAAGARDYSARCAGDAVADPAGVFTPQYHLRQTSSVAGDAVADPAGSFAPQYRLRQAGPVAADAAMAGSLHSLPHVGDGLAGDAVMSGGLPPHPAVVSGSLPLNHPWQRRTDEPAPAMSGCLPLPQPRDGRPVPLFPAVHGSLPLDTFADADADDAEDFEDDDPEGPPAESHAEQAARRTRVSLASPAPRCVDVDEDDARVYSAPPIDGLGGFTIGSVPASVTPPKTWRKAAWFATGASGAVVVGLLCAGSFLVGKPPVDQAVQGSWPGYQGVPTVADPTSGHRPPTEGGSAAGPETAASSSARVPGTTSGGGGAGPVDGVPAPPARSTEAPSTATTGPATADGTPRKPPVTPAQRETPVKPPWWYSFPPDAQTMGDNSEKFFNTVTTDPTAASSVTTGELHDQGPQALARRYAGIAYFEVKKVSIDQQRGVTVNTVEVTHTDGTKTVEQRTLTFGDGDKITADGQ